ncbi:MAG: GNAT family N-acetyltransferase [Lachnospiraceae bacterium]|nr:GNAT family N-acetyltransferase [Lachnospiraceae bacterium]
MLIRRYADESRFVWLTDEPSEARNRQQKEPIIGITGPEPEYSLWFGVSYLAEDCEAVTPDYAERVWCRFHGEAAVILKGEGWCLREMKEEDLEGMEQLYEDREVKRFLPYPLGERFDSGGIGSAGTSVCREAHRLQDWQDWLQAYRREVYELDEPAMWVIADENDRFLGRLGLEWKELPDVTAEENSCDSLQGYFLGYALLPRARGKGLATKCAASLLAVLEERYGIETVYLICEKENQASIRCAGRLGFQKLCNWKPAMDSVKAGTAGTQPCGFDDADQEFCVSFISVSI